MLEVCFCFLILRLHDLYSEERFSQIMRLEGCILDLII